MGDVVVVNTEQVGLVIKRLIALDEETLQVAGITPLATRLLTGFHCPGPYERESGPQKRASTWT